MDFSAVVIYCHTLIQPFKVKSQIPLLPLVPSFSRHRFTPFDANVPYIKLSLHEYYQHLERSIWRPLGIYETKTAGIDTQWTKSFGHFDLVDLTWTPCASFPAVTVQVDLVNFSFSNLSFGFFSCLCVVTSPLARRKALKRS